MKSGKKTSNAPRKKPYRSPALTVHGDLRRLTQMKGGTMNDAGLKPTTRVNASGAA